MEINNGSNTPNNISNLFLILYPLIVFIVMTIALFGFGLDNILVKTNQQDVHYDCDGVGIKELVMTYRRECISQFTSGGWSECETRAKDFYCKLEIKGKEVGNDS